MRCRFASAERRARSVSSGSRRDPAEADDRSFPVSPCWSPAASGVSAGRENGWGGLAGYLALVALASVCLYHGVEKPAQGWLNARRPRWAQAPRLAAAE